MADTAAPPMVENLENFRSNSHTSSSSVSLGSSPTPMTSVEVEEKTVENLNLKTVNRRLSQRLGQVADAEKEAIRLTDSDSSEDEKAASRISQRTRGASPARDKDNKSKRGQLVDLYGNQFVIPDFSINDIRKAIPKHCFVRSVPRSFLSVARDICMATANWYIFHSMAQVMRIHDYSIQWWLLWALPFALVQGWIFTGIWVLAHECGHQAFSESKTLNDTVGYILHSFLFVPYFSWKISHGKHHKATGHLDRDMVFVPSTREKWASKRAKLAHEISELAEETPLFTLVSLIGQQLVGWILYLYTNTTGHNNHERAPDGRGKGKKNGLFGGVNHFNPSSPLYEGKDSYLIFASDIGLVAMMGVLYLCANVFGWQSLVVGYVIPYFWVNNWLVWITYLQHTDPTLPHYDAETWTFVRGAAATIDRDFGFIGKYFMHGIVETHVLHHYVSTIPHYHADEASEAIKPVMGPHYRANVENGLLGFLAALWHSSRWCQWVEPTEGAEGEAKGVHFYRNTHGYGTAPAKLTAPES